MKNSLYQLYKNQNKQRTFTSDIKNLKEFLPNGSSLLRVVPNEKNASWGDLCLCLLSSANYSANG